MSWDRSFVHLEVEKEAAGAHVCTGTKAHFCAGEDVVCKAASHAADFSRDGGANVRRRAFKEQQEEEVRRLTHLGLPVLVLGALQNVVNDSASGGIGKEGLSVVDSEAGAKQITPSGLRRGSARQHRQRRDHDKRRLLVITEQM